MFTLDSKLFKREGADAVIVRTLVWCNSLHYFSLMGIIGMKWNEQCGTEETVAETPLPQKKAIFRQNIFAIF